MNNYKRSIVPLFLLIIPIMTVAHPVFAETEKYTLVQLYYGGVEIRLYTISWEFIKAKTYELTVYVHNYNEEETWYIYSLEIIFFKKIDGVGLKAFEQFKKIVLKELSITGLPLPPLDSREYKILFTVPDDTDAIRIMIAAVIWRESIIGGEVQISFCTIPVYDEERETLYNRIDMLEKENNDLKATTNDLNNQIDNLNNDIASLNARISSLNDEIANLQETLTKIQEENSILTESKNLLTYALIGVVILSGILGSITIYYRKKLKTTK